MFMYQNLLKLELIKNCLTAKNWTGWKRKCVWSHGWDKFLKTVLERKVKQRKWINWTSDIWHLDPPLPFHFQPHFGKSQKVLYVLSDFSIYLSCYHVVRKIYFHITLFYCPQHRLLHRKFKTVWLPNFIGIAKTVTLSWVIVFASSANYR